MATPLKLERTKRGIGIPALAKEMGVAQPTINRIENGKKRPSPELAKKLSHYFDNAVTRDQIMFPEEYPETAGRKPIRRPAPPVELQEAS
jgi:transcriptional regulator with XRE-family HTH domain